MTLVPEFTFGSLVLTDAPFSVEFGADLGNPEDVVTVLNSLLADGEIELTDRTGNRTLQIPLMIDDSDLLALAEAERLLALECAKARNTLKVDPGDGIAPPTVFETFRGNVIFKRDDDEEQSNVRRFTMTVRALPHGRSVDKITDTAGTPPSSGGTVLMNFESTTGWAAYNATYPAEYVVDSSIFTEGAGSLRSRAQWFQTNADPTSTSSTWDKITGLSLSTGTGGYLSVAVRPEWTLNSIDIFVTTSDGKRTHVDSPLPQARDSHGFVRYVWPTAGGLTITGLEFIAYQTGPVIGSLTSTTNPPHHIWYDDFELMPSATTDHQIVKQLDVQGSARTTGALHIASPTDSVALGQVLAITVPTSEVPAGFQPDVRRWVVSGATTTDSTALWGSYFTGTSDYSTSGAIFEVPVAMLTAGPYTMVALVKTGSNPLAFGVEAQLKSGGSLVGPVSTAEVSVPNTSSTWRLVTVGTVYLPPTPMLFPDSTSVVRLRIKGSGTNLADFYMIPQSADFSIVDCGAGTVSASAASSHLWIDSPSPEQPQGGWWRGPAANRTNARSAWPDAKKPGVHAFEPGSLTAFLVSTGAQGPTLALEYYPAWRTNAAL